MGLWTLYAALTIASASLATWVFALAARPAAEETDTFARERGTFFRLVFPLLMAAATAAFVGGWAIQEPNPTELRVGTGLNVVLVAGLLVVLRAAIRALCALILAREERAPLATVGLVRCRIVVAEAYRRAASQAVLSAAMAHEGAHAAGRDPLRIWLARFAADLQWPVPSARRRLQQWLLALELRRDDEAVAAGACATALAEGILLAARLQRADQGVPAGVGGDGSGIAVRVRRLLAEESTAQTERTHHRAPLWAWCLVLGTAVLLGLLYGEALLSSIPGMH